MKYYFFNCMCCVVVGCVGRGLGERGTSLGKDCKDADLMELQVSSCVGDV